MESIVSDTITVDTTSVFPFFEGEKLLVLIAPDDPNADSSSYANINYWHIATKNAKDEELGISIANDDATAEDLWFSSVKDVLYQTVSSSEVARRTTKVQAWIEQVVAAYQARLQEPIPLPTCTIDTQTWSAFASQHALRNMDRARELYPDMAEHIKVCKSHRRALAVFHTMPRSRTGRR